MKKLGLEGLKNLNKNSVVALGFFDGVHKAHQEILSTLTKIAKENNYQSVVITFDDSILKLFKITNSIYPTEKNLKFISLYNVDKIIELEAKDNFMNLEPMQFVKKYLNKLHCKIIVCGTDFTFGKDRIGNANFIKEHTKIKVVEVPDLYDDKIKISSTYIRKLLKDGKIEKANTLLFENFSITSSVVYGKGIGKTLNFKTANLALTENANLLKHGVYAGKVNYDNRFYKAAINVGVNPTIASDNELTIEVHLIDAEIDLYGKEITVTFLKFIREDVKFNTRDELKKQIEKDVSIARKVY